MSAQSLSEAQALYNKGDYAAAMPTFKRYVKSQPDNANYNLWYGVCCLKTDNAQEGLKYLQTAVKRRAQGGQLYLGQAYNNLYRYEDAIDTYETYIEELEKRKRSTDEAEKLLDDAKRNLRMLKSVEKVCVVDSFVVDKENFLETFKIGQENGKIMSGKEFFGDDADKNSVVYMTEMGDKILFSRKDEDGMNIYSSNKMQNEWSSPAILPERINGEGDTNYPFFMPDGVTIYFASKGANSIGGYDIFVTRYNSANDGYYAPENIGMPFNSPSNDYMYAIDEYNNLGWFASDRNQPGDKVCIYVFIPNESKNSYEYESMDEQEIINLAKLNSIKATWNGEDEELEAARKRLAEVSTTTTEVNSGADFTFVVDDNTDYHHLTDFKSEKAAALFTQLSTKESDCTQIVDRLNALRERYAVASDAERKNLSAAILDAESSVKKLSEEIDELSLTIRSEEKKTSH
jgi:tetratricopeptide (TPR) repeat protein